MKCLPIALLLLASCCTADETSALCENPVLDSAFSIDDNEVVFIQDGMYWIRNETEMVGPFVFEERWKDGPNKTETAIRYPGGPIYFTQYDQVWVYDQDDKLVKGSPVPEHELFQYLYGGFTVSWSGHGHSMPREFSTLFYTNIMEGSGINHTLARGLADKFNTTAAFRYKQDWYFFNENEYYKVEDYEIVEADPPYPRSVTDYWFFCGDQKFTDADL